MYVSRVKAAGTRRDYMVSQLSECWSTSAVSVGPKQSSVALMRGKKILDAAKKKAEPSM